jgi:hypothetical protein
MKTLKDFLNDNILYDNFSLKTKIKKKRSLLNEKKPFRDKKEIIEKELVKDLNIIPLEALPWRFIFNDNSKNHSWNEVGCINYYHQPSEEEKDWWIIARPRPVKPIEPIIEKRNLQ